MSEKTIDGFTLADVLAWQACDKKNAVLAGLLGDDLKARDDVEICDAIRNVFTYGYYDSPARMDFWDLSKDEIEPFASCTTENALSVARRRGFVPIRDYAYFLWLWDKREGKPYCADLEAAVSAWRRVAPAYLTDWAAMGALIDLMRERGFRWRGGDRVSGKQFWYMGQFRTPGQESSAILRAPVGFMPQWGVADSLPHAVTNAAMAALWNEETKGGDAK